jgi:DNA-binding NarL/FixJ family response regulator
VIADDQRVVRDGLVLLVGLIDDVEIVGTAADGDEAVELARDTTPDVVLMDLRMPELDGAEATRVIRSALPATQVLVLTTYADDESLFPALQAGRAATSRRTRPPRRSSRRSAPSRPAAHTSIRRSHSV